MTYIGPEQGLPCPYCGQPCDCDTVDVGVGYVQCGPYHCEACGASEGGPNDDDNPTLDTRTRWFPPGAPPSPDANVINGRIVTADDALRAYKREFTDNPMYAVLGAVEEWRNAHRKPRRTGF